MRVFAWLVLLAAIVRVLGASLADAAPPPDSSSGPWVELRCRDHSVLRGRLLAEPLPLETRYGRLAIPPASVRSATLALRLSPADEAALREAFSRLGHDDFAVREAAQRRLVRGGERTWKLLPSFQAESTDSEVARRLVDIRQALRTQLPAERLDAPPWDVLVCGDDRYSGRLALTTLTIDSPVLGRQTLAVADLLGWEARPADDPEGPFAGVLPAPATLADYAYQFGREYTFVVTGKPPPAGGDASVWGDGQYSLDSDLALAAVHAGRVRPAEQAVVRVRIIESPPQFVSSRRHGVVSRAYGSQASGAFEFVVGGHAP